mgnify:CR=1 FL=1|tara:strand:+ start:154 stop:648 length:495 start_codon:yes stop_codon:yes gene_type:complete
MDYNQFLENIYSYVPNVISSIIILLVFLIFSKVIKRTIERMFNRKNSSNNISKVLSNIVKNIIVIVGVITALGTLGVNVSAIVAGLGLTGFAFGFAFKDMLSNFISGVIIFIYEPFKLGDSVEIEKKVGRVIDINLRYVTLETDTENILVPNSICVSKVVVVNK